MPELPEVERFREILLPLVSSTAALLEVECPSSKPPKRFLAPEQIQTLQKCHVKDVRRKGKLLCLILQIHKREHKSNCEKEMYCFLHMGMTGRISNPSFIPKLESLGNDDSYPPPHTHLILRSNGYEAAYSDPRKFGAVTLSNNLTLFDDLATDALDPLDANIFVGQKRSIKVILLDQKAVVSGVGNWVADEVFYQSQIHPEQKYLTLREGETLLGKLQHILQTAVLCLNKNEEFPKEWIFHRRWDKKRHKKRSDKRSRRSQHFIHNCRWKIICNSQALPKT